jgi:hypothetical protein
MPGAKLAQALEIALWRGNNAGRAGNRLDNDGGMFSEVEAA